MTTKNATISMEERDLARYQDAAKQAGLSFSAFMARAARAEYLRTQGARYRAHRATLSAEEREFQGAWATDTAARLADAAR